MNHPSIRLAATVSLLCTMAFVTPALSQITCRPATLGIATCPGADILRPEPRPPGFRVNTLEEVRENATDGNPEIIPASRVRTLDGSFEATPRAAGSGFCRGDTLGNLRCR